MCGIVCTVGYDETDVNDMLDIIEHRGRDNRGIFFVDDKHNVFFGHNRLSINDVSELGNQPMYYEGIWLVVNGEIWNYPELRKEYEERGYTFKSNSDSEIILYLYKEDELNRLDGMFSFVIYDKEKLIISRDWVGKIPLFIDIDNNYIIASEIKSILHKKPESNIRFIPKNTKVTIDLNTREITEEGDYYFNFSDIPVSVESRDDVAKKTYELLDNSVTKRLLSDVPIATCLSGGIDSSVITYLLSKKIPGIVAYTVKFDEESRDLLFARRVAEHLGIELIEVEIPREPEILKERFLDSIRAIEYPSTVQMQVGILQSFIAEEMNKNGIKVAFSGEGSDEAYGSYGRLRMFSKKPDWSSVRKQLFEKQYYGNLLRGNNIFMKYGTIELRCPFFDKEFLDFTTNLPSEYTSYKSQWKKPLADAFRGCLPETVLEQEKRAFQSGTNFKDYINDVIMNDPNINFGNRSKMFHVISDNFLKINGFSHRKMRDSLEDINIGLYKFT